MAVDLLEHVDHVVQVNEGVIDGHHIGPLLQGGSQHQTPDAAKSVDSDSSHGSAILKVFEGDNKIFTVLSNRMSLLRGAEIAITMCSRDHHKVHSVCAGSGWREEARLASVLRPPGPADATNWRKLKLPTLSTATVDCLYTCTFNNNNRL